MKNELDIGVGILKRVESTLKTVKKNREFQVQKYEKS